MAGDDTYTQALQRLRRLMDEARARGISEPEAAALATADASARPSVRTVYILSVDPAGLLFFARLDSGKGHQLTENPQAAACFYWQEMQEQVIVEGTVELLSESESDRHWEKRSREAQLGSWASDQGEAAESHGAALERQREFRRSFSFEPVPRHAQWRAFRIHPERIEFWQSGWHRLRERLRYHKDAAGRWSCDAVEP